MRRRPERWNQAEADRLRRFSEPMTEDRVPTPPRLCPDCGEAIIGAAHWHEDRAMTENRVPSGNLVDALMGAWRDGDTYVYTKDQMRAIIDSVRSEQPAPPHRDYAGRTCTTGLLHSHPSEQPAPPLDVERLWAQVGNHIGEMIWFAGDKTPAEAHALACKVFDAILSRLGSAPSRSEPE